MLAEPGTRGAQLPGSSWPPGLPGHRPTSAPCLFLTLLHSAGKVGMGEGWSGCARNFFYPQATRERKVVVVINHVKKGIPPSPFQAGSAALFLDPLPGGGCKSQVKH